MILENQLRRITDFQVSARKRLITFANVGGRTGWDKDPLFELFDRLDSRVHALYESLDYSPAKNWETKEAMGLCEDIHNYAGMIWDKLKERIAPEDVSLKEVFEGETHRTAPQGNT